ncbi:hypothetical protein SASPL_154293 [Salvia splendens]|uniref:Tf2-1-like SH3-like domain-containing protein n=1 Tax=Salvia splendens TaxID=180675 RepID=A0A8X8VZU9_SALSN|nr:hypothetical protein SASPL_154293 [Salvia splendens]
MTQFETVYGRPPPTLHAFLPGEIRAQSVLDTLRSRDECWSCCVSTYDEPKTARIGKTAYRLQLPDSAHIHPMFHVSLLKRAVGDAPVEATLPDGLVDVAPLFLPDMVLARRTEHRADEPVEQVLISWVGLEDDEATWMDEADVRGQFPFFSLADKAVPTGGAIDTVNSCNSWKVYSRRKKGKEVGGSEKLEEASGGSKKIEEAGGRSK